MKRLIFSFALVFTATTNSFAAPELGDFNADGASDLSVALVYRSQGSTAWLTRLGPNQSYFWTFGVPADAFVTGHWFGDQKYYPGVIYVRSARLPLEWYIKDRNGRDIFLNYGIPGDQIPNQGDLDCDGITDIVVTRNGRPERFPGHKIWYVAQSGSQGQILETLFGLSSDRVGTADIDGDGCQELVVLRDNYLWFSRKLKGDSVTQVQWGLPGDLPLMPQDISGDGRADYVITRPTGRGQVAYVKTGSGVSDFSTYNLGGDSSIPQIGKFRNNRFFAWHQRNTGWVALGDAALPNNIGQLVQFGIEQNAIIRADGTVVQPTEDGRFPGSVDDGDGDPNDNPLGCTVTQDFKDGPNGSLWKPISDSTGRVVFLLASSYWSGPTAANSLEVLGRDGTKVASVTRRSCCPNGGRAHFDVSKKATELKPSAPLVVRMRLNNNTTECRTVADPTVRYD